MPITKIKKSPISDGVSRRFFKALDWLQSLGLINSLEDFCNEYGLSSPRYREMRLTYGRAVTPGRMSRYKNIEIEALYYLAINFPVSSDWLLTGRGEMKRLYEI